MTRIVAAAAGVMTVTGCGTLTNLDGRSTTLVGLYDTPAKPFGGVANAVRWEVEALREPVETNHWWGLPLRCLTIVYLPLVELPLSLVGDLVTLPVVLKTDPPSPDSGIR